MKFCILLIAVLSLFEGSLARSLPRRNGVLFYQAAPVMYRRSPLTHRMMYLQYVQPRSGEQSSSEVGVGGVSAFAVGNKVATTGTFLKENGAAGVPNPNPGVSYHRNTGVTSIAESYPAIHPVNEDNGAEVEDEFHHDSANDVNPQQNPDVLDVEDQDKEDENASIPQHEHKIEIDDPQTQVPVQRPEPPVVTAVAPPRSPPASTGPAYIPPKKKIHVELDSPDSDEYEYPQTYYVPQRKKPKKGSSSSGSSGKLPPGTFFPIDFGGTSGGAIAIANSFSTGDGGSATSHATAYGSPSAARTNFRKRTHRK